MDTTAMAVLLGILVPVLLGAFLFLWRRDKERSDKVADDPERLDAASSGNSH